MLTFLNFLQENNPQLEKFLPPLCSESRERWKSTFLGGISTINMMKNKNQEETFEWVWEEREKLKIEPKDFLKLRFLGSNFSSLNLQDGSLIQISLKVKAEDLCEANRETISSRFDDFVINVEGRRESKRINP